ncbi:DUF1127 domain-containing protein [Rhodovulum euryhalinum]|uniref:Uncharacterized protein DUF1127 n=1 Tax=Rhodovulum euryhalinum TaxID=35805 RepID=A0A4R2KJV3_9RHOB|nr:DUF1127 domain-containing protein [Rhodovulum euryhalinum]TCO70899.1 uncharacterized protein DUF1127 [Rhodovulum euryhalinum]
MAHIDTNTRRAIRLPELSGLVRRISLGLCAAHQRRRLADLDDAMLRDIGLTREQARAEARRPVWDVPKSWLR